MIGHTKLENSFLDWISTQVELSSLDLRCLFFIVRKTIGFRKEWDKISYTQFKKNTLASFQGIQNSLERLEKLAIIKINKQGRGKINSYKVLKCSCITTQVELSGSTQAQLSDKKKKENKQIGMDTNHSDGDGVIPIKEKYELIFKDGKPSHYKEI